jgi:hypothetical protein
MTGRATGHVTPAGSIGPSPPRDAVIFLPGLGADWGDHRLDEAAQLMADAFERAATAAPKFSVKLEVGEENYAPDSPTRRCTILREDASGTTPVLDMYAFYYQSTLRDRFERRNLLVKALLVLAAIVIHVPKVIVALFRGTRGKSRKDMIQVLQAVSILLLLIVYMGVLVWALIQTVTSLPAHAGKTPKVTTPQVVVVLRALIGAMDPGIREWVSKAAVNYVSLIYYVLLGEQRSREGSHHSWNTSRRSRILSILASMLWRTVLARW